MTGHTLAIAELSDDVQANPPMSAQLRAILDAPLPAMRRADLRRQERKEWAKAVRKLMKDMGLVGVSVTTPSYSMASSIEVRLPEAAAHERGWQSGHDFATCPTCQQRNRAERRIVDIIVAAFPDMRDRSDYQSDYFDFALSIH